MGLLDSVIGALGQGPGGGAQPDLMSAVAGMLAGGGLSELVAKFQQGGLGDVMASWVGTGQNLPISPGQLSGVLGPDTLSGLAQQLGLPQADVAGSLSQMLPQLVDKLTPHGQVPAGGLGDIGSLLGGLLGR